MSSAGSTTAARIGINAHLLAATADYRRAGIHQYIYQTLRHLPQDMAEYLVFTQYADDALRLLPGLRLQSSRWPQKNVRSAFFGSSWRGRCWPGKTTSTCCTAWPSSLPLSSLPQVVTVYDLSFMLYPERFPPLQRLYLQTQTRRSCRRARRVITISESSRQDVHHLFGVSLEKIDVITPGVAAAYRPLPAETVATFRQQQGLPEQFILHVGTLQPRKNITTLLEALAQIPDRRLPLVLVGGKGWLFDEIFARVTALGLQDRVRFTGYVADEALPLWYNAATLLAFPSLYEGFGMPVVEAMACGTPVVRRRYVFYSGGSGKGRSALCPPGCGGIGRGNQRCAHRCGAGASHARKRIAASGAIFVAASRAGKGQAPPTAGLGMR